MDRLDHVGPDWDSLVLMDHQFLLFLHNLLSPSPSVSVVLIPIGSHGSFGSRWCQSGYRWCVDGSSIPVVSSQSVKSITICIRRIEFQLDHMDHSDHLWSQLDTVGV